MDRQEKVLRLGSAVILCALLLRLCGSGLLRPAAAWLLKPETQAFLIYLETGRIVRFSPSLEDFSNSDGESAAPVLPEDGEVFAPEIAVFSREDAALVDIYYGCDRDVDVEAMLRTPLTWDLRSGEPTVLILHTHATESYTRQGEPYTETSAWRTLDEGYNMISVGEAVAAGLEEMGIRVIHDRTLHDYPSYNGSYNHARQAIQNYLQEYPSIRLVLDLHRDASGDPDNQLRTLAEVEGQSSAQLMLVIGTNGSGLSHPDWEENMALGVKLHAQLERLAPGITRPIVLRSQRFNQDLSPGALLIEVGAAGNSHQEAITAARVLAQAIGALSLGAKGE